MDSWLKTVEGGVVLFLLLLIQTLSIYDYFLAPERIPPGIQVSDMYLGDTTNQKEETS